MSERPSIVVLTPLKNDAWILRRFLDVTSVFADLIIVADQGSTDGGLEICREFEKVIVIDNSSSDYDEASRQEMLIATVRSLVPLPRRPMAPDSNDSRTAPPLASPDRHRATATAPGPPVA